MPWYLHIDMDAFYASVEQALDPSLAGKAVIVGGAHGRGVVTSASYEARKFGVHSAMPGFQASKLCPHGIFLPNRMSVYSDFSDKVFAILGRYSPAVHALSIDEAVLDLTGTERLFGPPLKTAERIIKEIKTELSLPSSGGVSTSRVVAKIAATLAKPQGLIFVTQGSESEFLSPLELKLIPGVGPKTEAALNRKGLATAGDLLRRPELAAQFFDFTGSSTRERHHDHSVGNETTFTSLTDPEHMEQILWTLVEEVGARLRDEGLYARALTLKIRYANFETVTRSRTLAAPTCFDREIFAVVQELLRRNLLQNRAVRLLGVSASALQSAGWQEPLFDARKRKSLAQLYSGIDELRKKYGSDAIGAATPKQRGRPGERE
jgi:DNA polymerase-4